MKRNEILKQLNSLVNEFGPVKVAYWLNLNSTETIRTWRFRKEVPKSRHEAIKKLAEKKL